MKLFLNSKSVSGPRSGAAVLPDAGAKTARVPTLIAMLGIVAALAGCAAPEVSLGPDACGVEYRLQLHKDPRPNRVHILRADLSSGKLRPQVVIAPDPDGDGSAEAALTHPLELANDRSVLAFINTNPWDSLPDAAGKRNRSWFEGQQVDIHGLAASGAKVRSPSAPGGASVWVDARGRVRLGDIPRDGSLIEGMGGFQPVVRAGAVVAAPGGPLHPRTAIGVDRTGKVIWLVVVDGRQPGYSEGMTLQELGAIMRSLDCWNAINMDGGGSSIMGLADAEGRLRIVNQPSGGLQRVRPLPAILTLQRTSGCRLAGD